MSRRYFLAVSAALVVLAVAISLHFRHDFRHASPKHADASAPASQPAPAQTSVSNATRLTPSAVLKTTSVTTPAVAGVIPAVASTTQPTAPLHEVKQGESVAGIVHKYLPQTTYMTGSELEAALRKANPDVKGTWPKPGTTLTIPNFQPGPWIEKPIARANDYDVRAVYLTGTMAGSARGLEIIRKWKEAGGNAVVFDIKDSDGLLSIPFDHPLAPSGARAPIRNLPKFTRYLHSMGMHAIARIAIFRDEHIATKHSELTIRSRRSGEPWQENGKLVWTDPSRREVWDYNIALARFAAASGADEVQFDYVRFPAEGDQKDAKFFYEAEHPQWKRSDVIVHFLEQAHKELRPLGVLLSLDVFGVMAWQRPVDLSHTGQDIPEMAKHCDVLSPMIYPSHFFGMDGYAMPGDAPEHFIAASMERFEKITAGTGVVLRPWLQAFGWKTKTYSPEYISTQVRVARDKGGIGFLLWNANNDYGKPLAAMPVMRAAPEQYFGRKEKAPERKPAAAENPTPSDARRSGN